MKAIWLTIPAVAALMFTGVASADLALAKKSGCMACHQIDKKVVGPAWNDIAAKYQGESDAKATIVESLKKGSRGKWGKVPMPPQGRLSDADAETLADFILTLK